MELKFKFDVHLESGFMTCTDRQQPSDFEAFAKKKSEDCDDKYAFVVHEECIASRGYGLGFLRVRQMYGCVGCAGR